MRRITIGVLLLSLASYASVELEQADKDFALRANSKDGKEHMDKAQKAYTDVLKDPKSNDADKLHAAARLGRLAYYRGDLLTSKDDHKARVEIFRQCVSDMDAIESIHVKNPKDPNKLEPTPEYRYWRATCLALQAKSSGAFAKLGLIGPLKTALKEGLEQGDDYADGGIDRVAAAVYINSAGRIFGLYHPEEALKLINKAVEKGPHHYNAYLIKADVLRELGKNTEADEVLRHALDKLEPLKEDQYPADLKPETREYLRLLKAAAPKKAEKVETVKAEEAPKPAEEVKETKEETAKVEAKQPDVKEPVKAEKPSASKPASKAKAAAGKNQSK